MRLHRPVVFAETIRLVPQRLTARNRNRNRKSRRKGLRKNHRKNHINGHSKSHYRHRHDNKKNKTVSRHSNIIGGANIDTSIPPTGASIAADRHDRIQTAIDNNQFINDSKKVINAVKTTASNAADNVVSAGAEKIKTGSEYLVDSGKHAVSSALTDSSPDSPPVESSHRDNFVSDVGDMVNDRNLIVTPESFSKSLSNIQTILKSPQNKALIVDIITESGKVGIKVAARLTPLARPVMDDIVIILADGIDKAVDRGKSSVESIIGTVLGPLASFVFAVKNVSDLGLSVLDTVSNVTTKVSDTINASISIADGIVSDSVETKQNITRSMGQLYNNVKSDDHRQ